MHQNQINGNKIDPPDQDNHCHRPNEFVSVVLRLGIKLHAKINHDILSNFVYLFDQTELHIICKMCRSTIDIKHTLKMETIVKKLT